MTDPIDRTHVNLGYEEGAICGRDGCKGVISMHPPENCWCHIDAPCGACTAPRGYCPVCDWQEKDDPLVVMEISTIYMDIGFVERRKRILDPTKIDWRVEMHSNASQLCIGVYPPGTTSAEVEARVKGTFGGRFNSFGHGRFEYVAYTD